MMIENQYEDHTAEQMLDLLCFNLPEENIILRQTELELFAFGEEW